MKEVTDMVRGQPLRPSLPKASAFVSAMINFWNAPLPKKNMLRTKTNIKQFAAINETDISQAYEP